MRTAAEKVFKPKHIAIVGAADDNWSAGPGLKQADTTQDQGAHDPLAEFRLRNQQGPQPVRRDDQRLDGFAGIGVHQCRPARQLGQLAEERTGTLSDNRRLLAGNVLDGLNSPRQDDAQAMADIARLLYCLAGSEGAHRAKPSNPLDLRRLQNREHLVVPGLDDRPC